MDILEQIKMRRTIRKYRPQKIDESILKDLVDCGRLAPSASNRQPLEFFVVQKGELLEPVFHTLSWAGFISPEGTPREGEKPVAYIVVLMKKELDHPMVRSDVGAAIENILLAAGNYGIGGCWIGSVRRKELARILQVPEDRAIVDVVALGYPAETPVAEEAKESLRYYKDDHQALHVPKRPLETILHMDRWQV